MIVPVLLAATIVVAGGCIFKKSLAPNVEGSQKTTSVSSTSTKHIDTSNWKTYRNEELGFEIKYPTAWLFETSKEPQTRMGVGSIDELGRWKDRIGEVYWSSDRIDLLIDVHETSKTIEEMNMQLRMDYGRATTTIQGLSALRWGNAFHCSDRTNEKEYTCQKQDRILIQSGDRFYGIDFSLKPSEEGRARITESEWDAVLNSLKIFKSEKSTSASSTLTNEVEMSDWRSYRNEELGFEINVPPEWGKAEVWMQQKPQTHPETNEDALFPLFYDAVGRIAWRHETRDAYVEITGVAKRATAMMSLREASELIGVPYHESQVVGMNGCEAIKQSASNPPPRFKQNFGTYDSMLIKCDNLFFWLSADIVSASKEVGEKYKRDWIDAMSTFKPNG